jgi:hypothetical protein
MVTKDRQLDIQLRTGRIVVAVMLGLVAPFVAACSHDGSTRPDARQAAPEASMTDEQFVAHLLDTWLVRRDVVAVRGMLSNDFFLHRALRSPDAWPSSLRSMPDGDRAIRFPFACDGAPPSCRRWADCVESDRHQPGRFDLQRKRIDAAMIDVNPELRSRLGQEIMIVDFTLTGCNIGTTLFVEGEPGGNRRVLTIFYLAG